MAETREQIIERMAQAVATRKHDGQPLVAAALPVAVKAVTNQVRAFIGTFDEVRDDDGEDPVALTVRVKDVRHLLDQIDAELGGE